MIHVFRLGPVPVGNTEEFVFAAIDERGRLLRPEFCRSDAEGLSRLAGRHTGKRLLCEPSLAEAARPLGFEPAPLPDRALEPRAVLAYGLALAKAAGRPDPNLILPFFEACHVFWESKPWDLLDSDEPIRVELGINGRRRIVEGTVMGGGGEVFGLALYDEPGSIRRVAAAMDRDDVEAAVRVTSTAVTFDEEPDWAIDALRDAFRLERLPVPLRIKKGKPAAADHEQLLILTAVLDAIAAIASSEDLAPVETTAEAGGLTVVARVFLEDGLPELDLADAMDVPEPVPVPRASKTPRNAPCPCGSGRKYKKCHLAQDEERERAAREGTGPAADKARTEVQRLAERDPVHALDDRITADALALARKRWGRAFDPESSLQSFGADYALSQSLLGWSADHCPGPDGRTALELYIAERGATLDDAGRRLVAARRAAWFSYHEVVSLQPGHSITLRDMLAGGEKVVQERSGSRTVRPRGIVLGRVLDLGDRAVLAGCHLQPLPPREGELACKLARRVLRTRARKIPPAKLRDLTADGSLIAIWQDMAAEVAARPLPKLQNTDGEDLLWTADRFDIRPEATNQVLAGLLDLPDAQREEAEEGATIVSFIKQGNARNVLPTTLLGRAHLLGGTLRLETNSVERADRLRHLVEQRLGPLVSFRIREHPDPIAQLKERGGEPTALEMEPMPGEVLAAIRKVKAEHYQRWADEKLPALGGLTPREAAQRKGAPRNKVELLLAELEHGESAQPMEQRFDVASLRRELGLR